MARAEGIGTPIVVVSARGTEHDRVHALEIGADDYLVKPFSMRELVARVGAAARRGVRPAEERRGDAIEIEELRIDPREVQAFIDGKSAGLTPTEFKLLYTLALDRGRVVTRDELLQKVWGRRETHRDRTVDVFVRRLRQKIDRPAPTHSFIQTRFGVGYKLEPELEVRQPDASRRLGSLRHLRLVPELDLPVPHAEERRSLACPGRRSGGAGGPTSRKTTRTSVLPLLAATETIFPPHGSAGVPLHSGRVVGEDRARRPGRSSRRRRRGGRPSSLSLRSSSALQLRATLSGERRGGRRSLTSDGRRSRIAAAASSALVCRRGLRAHAGAARDPGARPRVRSGRDRAACVRVGPCAWFPA